MVNVEHPHKIGKIRRILKSTKGKRKKKCDAGEKKM
jgi:hypothetical protein